MVGPLVTSTPRASTRRCSTTTTGASGSSTCAGTTGARGRAATRRTTPSTASSFRNGRPSAGLIGPVTNIYPGTDRGLTEAPHLFKREGWYYLTTAEGGTGYDHAVTMARSRDIRGPYETHPQKHVITTKGTDGPIQRTGHGQYVETHWGRHYHSFLMGRPIPGPDGTGRYCPLGRETGLEEVVWRDGWLWLAAGGTVPRGRGALAGGGGARAARAVGAHVLGEPAPGLPVAADARTPERIFRCEPEALVLIGRESIGTWFDQALVARRQEHLTYAAETVVEFAPETYQQAAGLVTYYNRYKLHGAWLTHENGGPALVVASCPGDWPDGRLVYPAKPVPVAPGPVDLRVEVDRARQRFFWRQGGEWQALGPVLDASVISDEGGRGRARLLHRRLRGHVRHGPDRAGARGAVRALRLLARSLTCAASFAFTTFRPARPRSS